MALTGSDSKHWFTASSLQEVGQEGDYTQHHQDDSCIKMGSDESHLNVLLIARDKV